MLRDAADVLRHARPLELARLLLPARLRPPVVLNVPARGGAGAVSRFDLDGDDARTEFRRATT